MNENLPLCQTHCLFTKTGDTQQSSWSQSCVLKNSFNCEYNKITQPLSIYSLRCSAKKWAEGPRLIVSPEVLWLSGELMQTFEMMNETQVFLFHTGNIWGGDSPWFQVAIVRNIVSYSDVLHSFIQDQNMFILNIENKLQRFFEKTGWPIWGTCPCKFVGWASKETLTPFFRLKSLPSFLDTCSIWIIQLPKMIVIIHLLPLLTDSNYEVFSVLVK